MFDAIDDLVEVINAQNLWAMRINLDWGTNPNLPINDTGKTPLMLAAESSRLSVEMVEILIEHNSDYSPQGIP